MRWWLWARLRHAIVLTYRTPLSHITDLLPESLQPVTHEGSGFWEVFAASVHKMRPALTPPVAGLEYSYVSYRLLVRCRSTGGRVFDGAYCLRSDINRALPARIGNMLTDFRFKLAKVRIEPREKGLALHVGHSEGGASDAHLRCEPMVGHQLLPNSGFSSIDQMRTTLATRDWVLAGEPGDPLVRASHLRRSRFRWREAPVQVVDSAWAFFEFMGQNRLQLERAVQICAAPYGWTIGRRILTPAEAGSGVATSAPAGSEAAIQPSGTVSQAQSPIASR
jgi:hypothetical protein